MRPALDSRRARRFFAGAGSPTADERPFCKVRPLEAHRSLRRTAISRALSFAGALRAPFFAAFFAGALRVAFFAAFFAGALRVAFFAAFFAGALRAAFRAVFLVAFFAAIALVYAPMGVDLNTWAERLRKGAQLAHALSRVLDEPELRAELVARLKSGTLEPALVQMVRDGRLTQAQADAIRRRAGLSE